MESPDALRTKAVAVKYYREATHFDGSLLIDHAIRVARLSEAITTTLYSADGYILPADRDFVDVAVSAGLLHGAMVRGMSFEDIAHTTGLEVARTVAAISSDSRLPRPMRVQEKLGRVANAAKHQQAVLLADIMDELETCVVLHRGVKGNQQQRSKMLSHVRECIGERCLELREYLDGINTGLAHGSARWAWRWAVHAADKLLSIGPRCHDPREILEGIHEHRWTIRKSKQTAAKRKRKWATAVRRTRSAAKSKPGRGGHPPGSADGG